MIVINNLVEFSDDQSTVEVDGQKYSAVEGHAPGRCLGCSFIDGFGCRLVERGLLFGGAGHTYCMVPSRADGRGIIWRPSARLVLVAPSPE